MRRSLIPLFVAIVVLPPPAHAAARSARFEFTLAGPGAVFATVHRDGAVDFGVRQAVGTAGADGCATYRPGIPSCQGVGFQVTDATAFSIGMEGLVYSSLQPGSARTTLAWSDGFWSGSVVFSCEWSAPGGFAGTVINGTCDLSGFIFAGDLVGVARGDQSGCDLCLTSQQGGLVHFVEVDGLLVARGKS